MSSTETWTPAYSPWRHGGWYVGNVRYPSGAVGCVSRNYQDRKWRIVCDTRGEPFTSVDYTYPNRDAAARAERELTEAQMARFLRLVRELSDFGQYPPEENITDGTCYLCGMTVQAGKGMFATGHDDGGIFGVHLHSRTCLEYVQRRRASLAESKPAASRS